jgi:uncharacterized protein (DUF736 family)
MLVSIGTSQPNGEIHFNITFPFLRSEMVIARKVTEKASQNHPDYTLFIGDRPCGAAWLKSHEGVAFLSANIESPAFPDGIIYLKVNQPTPGEHHMTWTRPREKQINGTQQPKTTYGE